ncbi:uncharacterized protein Bfra_011805 [Botrytis fragariae]|uniref:Uncharacterized protein n=1 Tax=Botrytis fragariae TaxID=1964551 RepID=A0A8H6AKB7_9HELO|nr:uncharacterized protein Bfra_011805 [Botrytis fragariae]KAF5868840.1 hypothetical protein Bfra_011805 [Botrytis fragariae]
MRRCQQNEQRAQSRLEIYTQGPSNFDHLNNPITLPTVRNTTITFIFIKDLYKRPKLFFSKTASTEQIAVTHTQFSKLKIGM